MDHEIVGTELRGGHQLAVAVQKLNWDVDTVLGEERDGLLPRLDCLLHLPDGRAFADKVGLAKVSHLGVLGALSLNDVSEFLILKGVLSCVLFFLLVVVLLIVVCHGLLHGVHHDGVAVHVVLDVTHLHVHADVGVALLLLADWGELLGVGCAGPNFAGNLI